MTSLLNDDDEFYLKRITGPQLDIQYGKLFSTEIATEIFEKLENEVIYLTGDSARVYVYGIWYDIPRKHVAYGDPNLSYTFSGVTIRALPWTDLLLSIRDLLTRRTGHVFNFVLINRYKDEEDKIGEHKDDEKELIPESPIASISLGQKRDFILRHELLRANYPNAPKREKITLEHGSLLLLHFPTNQHWFHLLPKSKKTMSVRINLTFRKMITF